MKNLFLGLKIQEILVSPLSTINSSINDMQSKRFMIVSEINNSYLTNSMKLVILLHSLYWSIHTKGESKRGTAFASIFGVN